MGRHHIRYAIMPHSGPLDFRTVRAGYNFNNPLIVQPASGHEAAHLFRAIELRGSPSLILDVIKRGEDDEDVSHEGFHHRNGKSVILRIYDSLGGKSCGTIETKFPIKTAWKCNVLEDNVEKLKIHGQETAKIDIELRAFEVATYRLQL
jgi:alpha-mannosidase